MMKTTTTMNMNKLNSEKIVGKIKGTETWNVKNEA